MGNASTECINSKSCGGPSILLECTDDCGFGCFWHFWHVYSSYSQSLIGKNSEYVANAKSTPQRAQGTRPKTSTPGYRKLAPIFKELPAVPGHTNSA